MHHDRRGDGDVETRGADAVLSFASDAKGAI
jgi:hypothetical protein